MCFHFHVLSMLIKPVSKDNALLYLHFNLRSDTDLQALLLHKYVSTSAIYTTLHCCGEIKLHKIANTNAYLQQSS